MDKLNNTNVFPVELVAARLEALAAGKEYQSVIFRPDTWTYADALSRYNYRAAAESVFDRECLAYSYR